MKNYLFKEIIDLIKYVQDKNTIGIITANDKMDKQNIVTLLFILIMAQMRAETSPSELNNLKLQFVCLENDLKLYEE